MTEPNHTPPPSAETPMPRPSNVQFIPPWEMVENGHGVRGGQTYAELQTINADLLAALEALVDDPEATNYCLNCGGSPEDIGTDPVDHSDDCPMAAAYDAIAKAKGENDGE